MQNEQKIGFCIKEKEKTGDNLYEGSDSSFLGREVREKKGRWTGEGKLTRTLTFNGVKKARRLKWA